MVKHNFLISGFGRSGTMFLSTVMNLSDTWTVKHEPRGSEDETRISPTPSQLEDFSQDYYGEVNSYLRYAFYDIPVMKRGIIIRDTKDIVKSIANRKSSERTKELIREVHGAYNQFYEWMREDEHIEFIEFEKMTTDYDYLDKLLSTFGIRDVDLKQFNIQHKINPNRVERYPDWRSIPFDVRKVYNDLDWTFKLFVDEED